MPYHPIHQLALPPRTPNSVDSDILPPPLPTSTINAMWEIHVRIPRVVYIHGVDHYFYYKNIDNLLKSIFHPVTITFHNLNYPIDAPSVRRKLACPRNSRTLGTAFDCFLRGFAPGKS